MQISRNIVNGPKSNY